MIYPNYQKCEHSPQFSESEFGVKVCFAGGKLQAVFFKDSPCVLFGRYRVGEEIIAEFGNKIENHFVVVVIHKESLGIYTGRILKEFIELDQNATADNSDVGGEITAMESYFNIDFMQQCRVPGEKGKYWVIILVGKLASPALEFEVQ